MSDLFFANFEKEESIFQRHYKRAPGKPDIALPEKKKAIFIDGDFWHGYGFVKWKKQLPKKYWLPKIEQNIKRDRASRLKLKKLEWQILRIWEHEIEKSPEKAIGKIIKFLKN